VRGLLPAAAAAAPRRKRGSRVRSKITVWVRVWVRVRVWSGVPNPSPHANQAYFSGAAGAVTEKCTNQCVEAVGLKGRCFRKPGSVDNGADQPAGSSTAHINNKDPTLSSHMARWDAKSSAGPYHGADGKVLRPSGIRTSGDLPTNVFGGPPDGSGQAYP